jgi:hypothetical protein
MVNIMRSHYLQDIYCAPNHGIIWLGFSILYIINLNFIIIKLSKLQPSQGSKTLILYYRLHACSFVYFVSKLKDLIAFWEGLVCFK